MGGIASGRRYQGGKNTTEGAKPVDIRKLHRAGGLTPGRCVRLQWIVNDKVVASIEVRVEVGRVVLMYRHRSRGNSEWQNVKQPVCLEHTNCKYGGERPWWLCPNCGRRVAILYCPGKLYACRHCYKLVYACQRETYDIRAARRANKIRQRLGWKVGIFNRTGGKPKGMHYHTYQRLTHKHTTFVGVSLDGMAKRLGMIDKALGGIDEDLNLFRKIVE